MRNPLTNLNQLYKSYELLRSAFSWMCQHLPSRQASCYHHSLSDELVADQVNDRWLKWQLHVRRVHEYGSQLYANVYDINNTFIPNWHLCQFVFLYRSFFSQSYIYNLNLEFVYFKRHRIWNIMWVIELITVKADCTNFGMCHSRVVRITGVAIREFRNVRPNIILFLGPKAGASTLPKSATVFYIFRDIWL